MSDTKLHHIRTFLQAAVSLCIREWQQYGPPQDWEFEKEKKRLGKALSSGGDDFLFGGRRGGAYAAALAESVAFMAFAPGGIDVFGLHFEATHKQEKDNPMDTDMRARIENDFSYHAPKEGQVERYQEIREKAKEFALLIVDLTPYSREQSLALTELEKVCDVCERCHSSE
jgi:hypothetical protein